LGRHCAVGIYRYVWDARVQAAAKRLVMLVIAICVGFRPDRSERASVGALTLLVTTFLILLTPHYPWYYLVLVPLLTLNPWSWSLWLLTVGSLQFYQALPGEIIPDFYDRQTMFHTLVLIAVARDLHVRGPRDGWFAAQSATRSAS